MKRTTKEPQLAATHTLQERPPVVAVLGHVDHGKSTLLDFIRNSNKVATEAGGITQHVAAYEVEREHEGKQKRITFIDTPGHAAFQAIRARGARAADVAILVVAADDGVKAQTLEALQSIRDADIPFVVAINKIDKPNADLMRTQTSLLEHGVYLEQLGGDVPWAAISAKQGTGVAELLDLVHLVADLQELKADPAAQGSGFVIESHRDQKRGIAATLIVTNGTIKKGDSVLAGGAIAPARIIEDDRGKTLAQATFSQPVTIIGFDTLPEVGAEFSTFSTKQNAEAARQTQGASHVAPVVSAAEQTGDTFYLPVVIRADTAGSLDAIQYQVPSLGDEYRRIALVQAGIGDVSENDVKLAIAAHAGAVIGFNVHIDRLAQVLAHQHDVAIETFDIIYKLTERLEELLKERSPKRTTEEAAGRARIVKVFSSHKEEHLVGCTVESGTISEDAPIRLLRHKEEIARGEIASMQSARKSVKKVEQGAEFGAQVLFPVEPLPGDSIESMVEREL